MVVTSAPISSKNRFAAIFTEEQEAFSKPHSERKINISSPLSSKKTPSTSAPTFTGSSLSKVDALLKYREAEKKRLIEEAEARKKAIEEAARLVAEEAERKRTEAVAKRAEMKKKSPTKEDDDFVTIGKDNRMRPTRISKIVHRKADTQTPADASENNVSRQIRRSHDREDRSGKKISSKKSYTGHKESIKPAITETVEPISKASNEEISTSLVENVKVSNSVTSGTEAPKNSIMTFDEYQSTKNALHFDFPKRLPNEGSGPNQFEKSTRFVRMNESFMGFTVNENISPSKSLPNPTSNPSHGGTFIVDPRLQDILSKSSTTTNDTSKQQHRKPFTPKKTSSK